MARRDLTYNRQASSDEERNSSNERPYEREIYRDESSRNPFIGQEEEEEEDSSGARVYRVRGDGYEQPGAAVDAYEGYYSGGVSHVNSYESVGSLAAARRGAGYDSAQGARRPYISHYNSNGQMSTEDDSYPLINSTNTESSESSPDFFEKSMDPRRDISGSGQRNAELDFSPFGGYPASSFPLHVDEKEPDDYLHNPDPIADANYDKNRFLYDLKKIDKRSLGGLMGVIFLFVAAMAVFIVLPVLTYSGITDNSKPESYEILTQYKYPLLSAIRTELVDSDTPKDALTRKSQGGDDWTLVFSDEFNVEGRTFYEGDDQFFTAVDFNYAVTHDLEWYDPDAVTTANGSLNMRLDAFKNHDLFYRSGMVQSWNQFCFTQGMIEFSCQLPSYGNVSGLWPGLWTMGNLGRPGYAATTDGVWPYSYEECDAGITPNQSSTDGISYLPGQRLASCVCDGEDHPNPGTGRGAPEIDAIEGSTDSGLKIGVASQSIQIAPFDIWYYPDYNFVKIHNKSVTAMNTYTGGPYQQAVSGTTTLNNKWYERGTSHRHFQKYGYEYLNDDLDGYVTWFVGEDPTLTVQAKALAPNGNIGWRRISKEPMALIMNLGLSNNWIYIDWLNLIFPITMSVDYVRVYQPHDKINVGCDPEDHPTYDYIQSHLNLYENMNLTQYEKGGYSFPKNKIMNGC